MRKTSRLFQVLTSKTFIVFSITVLACVMFRSTIESILTNTVVNSLLCHVESIWYNDLVILLIALMVTFFACYRFRKHKPSARFSAIIFIITIFYFAYRSMGEPWSFTSFACYKGLKYFDILFLIGIGQLLLFIPSKKYTPPKTPDSFFDDSPINEIEDDRLGYEIYARQLSNRILSTRSNKGFAIGINGRWGMGKTSFMNLLKRNIKGKDIIEVSFNTWNNHSKQAIIQDFFETIETAVKPFHFSLSRQLLQYSNKLVSLNSNATSKAFQYLISSISDDSIGALFSEINEILRAVNKKIIIYIDDLDRLDKKEIIEVVRLIRNTANFHNTFFITAYDRNYVINALSQFNDHNNEEFLEKIFQVEVTLPYFKKDVLRHQLAEKLKEKLPKESHSEIEDTILGSNYREPRYLNEWLDSMRDVTRFTNALLLNISTLMGEIELSDFIRIELLRLKYPSAYELLFRNTNDYLNSSSSANSMGKHYYQLKKVIDSDKLVKGEDKITSRFELYLHRNHSILSIPLNSISKIIDLLEGVFTDNSFSGPSETRNLSIIYPSKFNRYFAYSILEGTLSEVEFGNTRSSNFETFQAKIDAWIKQGLEFEIKNRFYEIKDFEDRNDYEKIIKAIFYLANKKAKSISPTSQSLIGYDTRDLRLKLSNYDNNIVDKFYSESDNGFEKLRSFVRKLLSDAIDPFRFEADFLKDVNYNFSDSFILEKEEIKQINLKYLKEHCDNVDEMDYYVWNLFHCCKQQEWIEIRSGSYTSNETIPKEAKEIIKNFFLTKDLDGFLLSVLNSQPFKDGSYSVSPIILKVFDSWEEFKVILEKISSGESKYLDEFKEFFELFGESEYKIYVQFEFKVIPVDKK